MGGDRPGDVEIPHWDARRDQARFQPFHPGAGRDVRRRDRPAGWLDLSQLRNLWAAMFARCMAAKAPASPRSCSAPGPPKMPELANLPGRTGAPPPTIARRFNATVPLVPATDVTGWRRGGWARWRFGAWADERLRCLISDCNMRLNVISWHADASRNGERRAPDSDPGYTAIVFYVTIRDARQR